jgi:hypothetical protein
LLKTWIDKHWYDFSKDADLLVGEISRVYEDIKKDPELSPKNLQDLIERINRLVFVIFSLDFYLKVEFQELRAQSDI